jgi:S1-C subfamily serine protease
MDTNINSQDTQNEAYEEVGTGSAAASTPEPNYVRVPYAPPYPATHSSNSSTPGKKRGGLVALMLSAMLMLGMLLGGGGAGALLLVTGHATLASPPAQTTTSSAASTTGTGSAQLTAQVSQETINSIFKELSPSVVMITGIVQSSNGRFGGTGEDIGTGLVIDAQGDILTNNHVINGASSLKITLADGSSYTANVVGTAAQDDLAIIKASVPSGKLTPAKLGDSSTVQVGDEVIAIGYPFGLDQSVTSGIVSGLNREGSSSSTNRTLTGLIQVDAAINPGNSGGPLLNASGEVIGINTMIEGPVDAFTGVGLSIPINEVKSLLQQLEGGAQVQRPWLGISGMEIDQALQTTYNLPVSSGILVVDVTSGGPAEQGGIKGSATDASGNLTGSIGDIITAIDGQKVASIADLTNYLNTKQPGDKVTVTIIRNGQQQNVPVTLQAWSGGSTSSSGN